MLSIAICDDDALLAESISRNLINYAKNKSITIETEVFGDGRDLVDEAMNGHKYDIIFLDIEMQHTNGLQAAKIIREVDRVVLIIYVTSYSEYAVEAYSVRPFQFLVKPFDKKLLEKYFLSAIQEISDDDFYFRYFSNRKSYKIPVKDILYFESKGRTVYITTKEGIRKYNAKLSHIENILKESRFDFWRIHQSFLVNRHHIYKTQYNQIELSDGTVLSISEDRRKYIREKYLSRIGVGIIE